MRVGDRDVQGVHVDVRCAGIGHSQGHVLGANAQVFGEQAASGVASEHEFSPPLLAAELHDATLLVGRKPGQTLFVRVGRVLDPAQPYVFGQHPFEMGVGAFRVVRISHERNQP